MIYHLHISKFDVRHNAMYNTSFLKFKAVTLNDCQIFVFMLRKFRSS